MSDIRDKRKTKVSTINTAWALVLAVMAADASVEGVTAPGPESLMGGVESA